MDERIRVGIVGGGFVGGALKSWQEANNPQAEVLVNDPPKGFNDDLSEIDVAFVQIHVPTEDDGTQDLSLMKDVNAFAKMTQGTSMGTLLAPIPALNTHFRESEKG